MRTLRRLYTSSKPFLIARKFFHLFNEGRCSHSRYDDGGPNLELSVEAQEYFKSNAFETKVLAAGFLNVDETKKLAGVDHMTLAIDLLYELSKSGASSKEMGAMSLFSTERRKPLPAREPISFIDDRDKYAIAFDRSYDGKGRWKTAQVRHRLRSQY